MTAPYSKERTKLVPGIEFLIPSLVFYSEAKVNPQGPVCFYLYRSKKHLGHPGWKNKANSLTVLHQWDFQDIIKTAFQASNRK